MIAALLPSVRVRAALAAALLSAACGGDGPVGVDEQLTTSTGCVLTREALDPGESVVLPANKYCVELTTPGSRYMVGVVHTGQAATSTAPYRLTGTVRGASAAPTTRVLADLAAAPREIGSGPMDGDAGQAHARVAAHDRLLEFNRALRSRLGSSLRSNRVAASPVTSGLSLDAAAAAPTSGLRAVGDTATLRIPDIDATNPCATFFDVKTRVAFVGQHAIILEDQAAPLAGQMDDTFRAIGQEYDTVMWPILNTYFGSPTKADGTLDGNGRIIMLFSPAVNDNFEGIAGFVIGCDFYPRTQLAASNEGEVFYAMVPRSLTGPLTSPESRDGWLRTMRSTLIHEAKHIASFAERFLQTDGDLEESWLEEGTARHAEELYARALNGAAWKGNAGYEAITCEVRPTTSGCLGRPYVMFKHFDALYDALAANGNRTPLGKANADDFTFYATAWAMTRWAADIAPNEAEFFKALTRGPKIGIPNLEAASGRAWGEIVADWTMAMALDDLAGLSTSRPQRLASWNLRSVYAGMNRDFPDFYTSYPVRPIPQTFGSFVVQNGSVRAGAGALTELTGTWAGSQVLEIEAAGGGAPSPSLRLVVTRVQ